MHYNNQHLKPQYHFLQLQDYSPHINSIYNQTKQAQSITPWDAFQNHNKVINPLQQFSDIKKNYSQKLNDKPFNNDDMLNFIGNTPKSKKNRSDLGKLRKHPQINKNNQYFHLNLSKIEFKQYQSNKNNTNKDQSCQNKNIKDYSSGQNNFFIRSYFYPNNNPKVSRNEQLYNDNELRRKQNQLKKKQRQYRKIKQIKGPSFIAIKSVDLKQKFHLYEDNEQIQSDEQYDASQYIKNSSYYSSFRTVSVLGSRKSFRRGRNISVNQNYINNQSIISNNEHHKYKTIQSTKQSHKQITQVINKDNYKPNLQNINQKHDNNNACNVNNDNSIVIVTNSSFIRRNNSRKTIKNNLQSLQLQSIEDSNHLQPQRHIINNHNNLNNKDQHNQKDQNNDNDQNNNKKYIQNQQNCQISSIRKKFIVSSQRKTRIQKLKQLKHKNQLQNLLSVNTSILQQKPIYRYLTTRQNSHHQKYTSLTNKSARQKWGSKKYKIFNKQQVIINRMDTININKGLVIFDKQHQQHHIKSLAKQIKRSKIN